MRNKENLLDKLRAQERGERFLGNHTLADNLLAKIATMQSKELPEAQKVDERAAVEAAWEAIAPSTLVVIDVIEIGLRRAGRRTCTMEIALPLLKSERARFVGRADANFTYPAQQTTENTPPIFVPDAKQLFI